MRFSDWDIDRDERDTPSGERPDPRRMPWPEQQPRLPLVPNEREQERKRRDDDTVSRIIIKDIKYIIPGKPVGPMIQ
jgi:hypothetical protein